MSMFEDLFADLTQPAEGNDVDDVPQLEFDTSTLTSSALSLDPSSSATAYMEGVSMDLSVDSLLNGHQFHNLAKPDVESEEIKRMLNNISTRLIDLECAVSAGNAQLNQLGFNIDIAMPRILGMADEFRGAIETLRDSLKSFARGLINHLVNCRIEDDVESGRTT
ncbi:hypothetical protein FGADI_4563 [Fusarium gaditjirri]|uniref:Uncharacterized protein n=1 Tax=Fusarium gaditjirri TaxID=282569 RepID=A0A8H4TD53_9HYPO|nr:hypothetical protein FGADI_4563 [Fusarium gaditjirri]